MEPYRRTCRDVNSRFLLDEKPTVVPVGRPEHGRYERERFLRRRLLRLSYDRNGKQYHRDQDWLRSFLHLRLIREFI